ATPIQAGRSAARRRTRVLFTAPLHWPATPARQRTWSATPRATVAALTTTRPASLPTTVAPVRPPTRRRLSARHPLQHRRRAPHPPPPAPPRQRQSRVQHQPRPPPPPQRLQRRRRLRRHPHPRRLPRLTRLLLLLRPRHSPRRQRRR